MAEIHVKMRAQNSLSITDLLIESATLKHNTSQDHLRTEEFKYDFSSRTPFSLKFSNLPATMSESDEKIVCRASDIAAQVGVVADLRVLSFRDFIIPQLYRTDFLLPTLFLRKPHRPEPMFDRTHPTRSDNNATQIRHFL